MSDWLDRLTEQERDKYARIWAAEYSRRNSPGENVAQRAIGWAHDLGAISVCDWGCGDGRALDAFYAAGLHACGIDIVRVVDRIDVYTGPCWAPPADLPAVDFAFSSDLLEHLPTKMVEPTLATIKARTSRGGLLQIALVPDALGATIGETLHLTVRPPDWWMRRVARHFHIDRSQVTDRKLILWI